MCSVHNVFLSTESLELVVFVSERKTLVKGDFERVKTIVFLRLEDRVAWKSNINMISKCINSAKVILSSF